MTLNELFRRNGEPTYYTPLAVVGELVNQDGGTVIINPPYQAEKPKRKWWKRSFRFGHFYLTFSNCRVKKRPTDGYSICKYSKLGKDIYKIKRRLYEKQNGCCAECGQHFEYAEMENHHVLPWGRFPDLRDREDNMVFLCHKCHKEIHCNPWRNIEMMKRKADELGIDLKERYDYGETDADC